MNNDNGPVTRAELKAEIQALMDFMLQLVGNLQTQLKADVAKDIADAEARMQEFTRDTQSELLRSFEAYAKRAEARWTVSRLLANDAVSEVEDLRNRLREKGYL